jgi:outer membrane lipoprotein-sorting protein
MRRLITLPARRLWTLLAAVCVLALGAGIAQAALRSGGGTPPAKPLDRAIRGAVTAPEAPGISARIAFVNHLLPSGSIGGQTAGSPLLQGATGRLWLTGDGRLRLELQSDSGDAQIVVAGDQVRIYDASRNTAYRIALPADHGQAKPQGHESRPTLSGVRSFLANLSKTWNLSGARPTSTAGRPSYTLRISPRDDGGLLGAAELAWDAEKGVPLRAAVYAQGQSDPVLAVEATDISYGPVPASDVAPALPRGTKVVNVDVPATHGARPAHAKGTRISGVTAVRRAAGFSVAAPARLAGLPRTSVRLVRLAGKPAAFSTYGRGLGAIAVLQQRAPADGKSGSALPGGVRLPQINIGGATGSELATPLGTVVTFRRAGISYVVAGSVPPLPAENAARGLR